ncbi:MAG: transglutaminase domain-containing protein [Acidobacteriota bacterium]|nr:transglutaminase domain-containing protein [Acidobacteriota bacterium]
MRRSTVTTALVSAAAMFLVVSLASFTPAVPAVPTRSLEMTTVTHVPAMPAGAHQLRVWIPLPYTGTDAYQKVSQLKVQSPVPYRVEREPVFGNRYAYVVVTPPQARKPFDIRISFHVERFEHRVSLTPSSPAPSAPRIELARYLHPDKMIPLDGQIGELSAEYTKGADGPIAKAQEIYDYILETMHYDHAGTGWGHGDAVWACNSKHGNCTDFHSLFIGMARAAKVPARFQIGLGLPGNAHSGAIASYHCWAEFYAPGIGWVPIDAAKASQDPSKAKYFFGAIDTDRVMFSMGRDIRLVPPQKGDPLNYFVYPYAELDGKPYDAITHDASFGDDAARAEASHGN